MDVDKNVLLSTIRELGERDRTITVHKSFVEFTGSLEAGMMLSQILYWSERSGNRGRFYKSDKEFSEELYITQYAIRQARGVLEKMEIIKTEVHRANGTPTLHYYLDEDALLAKWTLWIRKIEIAKSQNQTLRNQQIPNIDYTESTTENNNCAQGAPTPTIDTDKKANEEFDALPSASDSKPKTNSAPMSAAAQEFFKQFSRKRWGTPAERALFEKTENEVGADAMMCAVMWGAESRISNVRAICTAARHGKPRRNGNGNHSEKIINFRPQRESELARMRRLHPEIFDGEQTIDFENQNNVIDCLSVARPG